MPKLDTYLCSYFRENDHDVLYFKCAAEDAAHAEEQLMDAEPTARHPYCEVYARG